MIVIGLIILALGVASGVAYRAGYVQLFLALMALENEARKSRDKHLENER